MIRWRLLKFYTTNICLYSLCHTLLIVGITLLLAVFMMTRLSIYTIHCSVVLL